MSFTRRRFLVTAASLSTLAVGLSACNASAEPEVTAASPAPDGVEAGAFPVTIAHRYGETTVATQPQRVVTAGLKEQDDCLALGIVPVASTDWFDLGGSHLVGSWAEEALGSRPEPVLLSGTAIEFEKIAALQPDLIVAQYAGLTQGDYDKLSKIAPTVAQPGEFEDYRVPWDVEAATVGRALGRPARMAELIAAAKQQVADVAAAHPEFAGRTGAAATPYQGVFVYGAQDPRGRLLTDLGFAIPPALDQVVGSAFGDQLSLERLDLIDTDVLVWVAETDSRAEILKNKAYTTLDVHQQGRDVFVLPGDGVYEAFSFLTVLSVGFMAERLGARLAAALDGDPDTGPT